jgi:hypothetical protein
MDHAAGREHLAVPFVLDRERTLHAAERIHVLDLGAGPERSTRPASAHVGIDPETALLHRDVSHAAVVEHPLERAEVVTRICRVVNFRFTHDLRERHSGAIEVDSGEAGVAIVHRLP